MIRAVIFDCFGVLISDALTVMCETLESNEPGVVEYIWRLVGQANRGKLTADEASTRIAARFGLTLEQYRATVAQKEAKNQPLLDYILTLRKSYRIAMLSNIAVGSIYRRFTAAELQRYFDMVVISAEIGVAKPQKEAYVITASRLGVKPDECIFVDDREHYLKGAQSAGMRTVLYRDFEQFKRDIASLLANS